MLAEHYFLHISIFLLNQIFSALSGTELQGRRDWTDQQPVGTEFLGFTCCPVGYSSEYDTVMVTICFLIK